MKMQDTELECMACDEVCLDYYLGEHHETKEQWAKRVWDMCKLYKENNGLELDGEPLPKVYARDPQDIWEEKKRRRRAAFVKELTGEECDCRLLELENIKEDVKNKRECKWPKSHSTAEILRMKGDPKINYKTATERYHEQKVEDEERHKKEEDKRIAHVNTLRKKFDDETIAIIYPKGERYLNKPAASSTRKKVGKV